MTTTRADHTFVPPAVGSGPGQPGSVPPEVSGPAVPEPAWQAAVAAIQRAGRLLLVCHINPDGDALGSMLGCALGLRSLGLRVQATFPGPQDLPEVFAGTLRGMDLLVPPDQADADPDVLITFDAASPERVGEFADRMDEVEHVIVLDHHASNQGFGTINLVDPAAAATAMLVDELLRRLGVPLDPEIGQCLYVAVSTDTGSFKYQATTPDVHALAARLLAVGVDPYETSRRLFDTRPYAALKIFAEALGRVCLEPDAATGAGFVWTYTTLNDLSRHGQQSHVLESLIDVVRTAEEADVACVLKQTAEQTWAVSMRSRGAVDVAGVAMALGGGGHPYAAGFTGRGDLAAVVSAVRELLPRHRRH